MLKWSADGTRVATHTRHAEFFASSEAWAGERLPKQRLYDLMFHQQRITRLVLPTFANLMVRASGTRHIEAHLTVHYQVVSHGQESCVGAGTLWRTPQSADTVRLCGLLVATLLWLNLGVMLGHAQCLEPRRGACWDEGSQRWHQTDHVYQRDQMVVYCCHGTLVEYRGVGWGDARRSGAWRGACLDGTVQRGVHSSLDHQHRENHERRIWLLFHGLPGDGLRGRDHPCWKTSVVHRCVCPGFSPGCRPWLTPLWQWAPGVTSPKESCTRKHPRQSAWAPTSAWFALSLVPVWRQAVDLLVPELKCVRVARRIRRYTKCPQIALRCLLRGIMVWRRRGSVAEPLRLQLPLAPMWSFLADSAGPRVHRWWIGLQRFWGRCCWELSGTPLRADFWNSATVQSAFAHMTEDRVSLSEMIRLLGPWISTVTSGDQPHGTSDDVSHLLFIHLATPAGNWRSRSICLSRTLRRFVVCQAVYEVSLMCFLRVALDTTDSSVEASCVGFLRWCLIHVKKAEEGPVVHAQNPWYRALVNYTSWCKVCHASQHNLALGRSWLSQPSWLRHLLGSASTLTRDVSDLSRSPFRPK